MKIFLLFLLAILMPTASVQSKSDKCKDQYILLGEIIDYVNGLRGKEYSQIFVDNVISSGHCSPENFCEAGAVLSKYKADELGLQDKDWLLPRALVAYTRETSCKVKEKSNKVKLNQLLDNIKVCAQKVYSNPCL